ncbi:MAG: shikimate kinase [Candidatus Bathyarchaeia archaeon]
MIGEAISHGAGTIINAIATGKGAAFGVGLWTKARVELTDEPGKIVGKILSDPREKPILIEKVVSRVFRAYKLENVYGACVETDSNIPIARGLKSSSVAANALVLATIAALGRRPRDDAWAINLGVSAAVEAGVTITGAFDDASASYFGNVVVTDNVKRKIVKRFDVEEDLTTLFLVPSGKVYTTKVDVKKLRSLSTPVQAVYKEALGGRYWNAMTLNGLLYSIALGYELKPALEALKSGAKAAGLSGTGPSIASVVPLDRIDDVRECWQEYEGEIIETEINRDKARILRTADE